MKITREVLINIATRTMQEGGVKPKHVGSGTSGSIDRVTLAKRETQNFLKYLSNK